MSTSFVPIDNKSFYNISERFKDLLRKCPYHVIQPWQLIDEVNQIDSWCATGGSILTKTNDEPSELMEKVASNHHKIMYDRTVSNNQEVRKMLLRKLTRASQISPSPDKPIHENEDDVLAQAKPTNMKEKEQKQLEATSLLKPRKRQRKQGHAEVCQGTTVQNRDANQTYRDINSQRSNPTHWWWSEEELEVTTHLGGGDPLTSYFIMANASSDEDNLHTLWALLSPYPLHLFLYFLLSLWCCVILVCWSNYYFEKLSIIPVRAQFNLSLGGK